MYFAKLSDRNFIFKKTIQVSLYFLRSVFNLFVIHGLFGEQAHLRWFDASPRGDLCFPNDFLLVGEFANVYLLAKWKIYLKGKFFILRSLLSTAFGQACLTIIVDILNYLGKLSDHGLEWMMLCGYFWKMCCAVIMVFPAWLLVKYLKRVENIDYYDINTNFNPFVFCIKEEQVSIAPTLNIEPSPQ